MKIEVSKNMLAGALAVLGKLVSRMSPVDSKGEFLQFTIFPDRKTAVPVFDQLRCAILPGFSS